MTVGLCVGLLAAALPGLAHAQAEIDAALQDANEHAQRGDHRGAITILERARERWPSERLEVNLADNLAAVGELRQATRILRGVIDGGANPLVAEVARERLQSLEARLPTLTVMFREPPPASSRLMVDGEVEAQLIGARTTTITLDPGPHVVEVHDDEGQVLARAESALREGERSEVALMPAGLPTAAEAEESAPALDGGVDLDEALPWILAGAGAVVLVAIAVAIGVAASGPSPSMGNVPPVYVGGME